MGTHPVLTPSSKDLPSSNCWISVAVFIFCTKFLLCFGCYLLEGWFDKNNVVLTRSFAFKWELFVLSCPNSTGGIWYSPEPFNAILINDRPHKWEWPHKIVIKLKTLSQDILPMCGWWLWREHIYMLPMGYKFSTYNCVHCRILDHDNRWLLTAMYFLYYTFIIILECSPSTYKKTKTVKQSVELCWQEPHPSSINHNLTALRDCFEGLCKCPV